MSKSKSERTYPVEFGGLSIGEATARIGARIARDCINLEEADTLFCGHRLTGRVTLNRKNDAGGQQKELVESGYEIAGAMDVKRMSVSPGTIGIGLTFSLADVDISTLARFSKGTGRLEISGVAELPDEHE